MWASLVLQFCGMLKLEAGPLPQDCFDDCHVDKWWKALDQAGESTD